MTRAFLVSQDQEYIHIWQLPGIIAGALEPYDRADFSESRQAAIETRHKKALQKAALNGEIVGRNPRTKKLEQGAQGGQLETQVVTIAEANKYLKSLDIEIRHRPLPEESGRYTLEEAAKAISCETGENRRDILDLLVTAVQEKRLAVYKPGSDVCYTPSTVQVDCEEVFWDDLNILMDSHLPRIEWRFACPEKEENDLLTLAALFDEEPDYQEWKRLIKTGYAPLKTAICYAIGRPLAFDNRKNFSNWEQRIKEEVYTSLLNRADSDILSEVLTVRERNGKEFVSIKEYYPWIEQQGEALHPLFLELKPAGEIQKTDKGLEVSERSGGRIKSSQEGREKAKIRHRKTKEKKQRITELATTLIKRGKLNHSEIAKELLPQSEELSKQQVINAVKARCIELGKTNLILGHNDYVKPK